MFEWALTLEEERENETIRPPPAFICVSLVLVLPLTLSWDGVVSYTRNYSLVDSNRYNSRKP